MIALIVLAGVLWWFTCGFFAARLTAQNSFLDGWGEVIFLTAFGPISYLVELFDSDLEGYLKAHYLYNLPIGQYLINRQNNRNINNSVPLRVRIFGGDTR